MAIEGERSVAKLNCPVTPNSHERYGNVNHQIKKAQVQGMRSSAEKIAVKSIIALINETRENKEINKTIYSKEKCKSFIASLLCQLPGHQSSGAEGAASGLTQSTTGVEDITNNPSDEQSGLVVFFLEKLLENPH
jgi:hypothetical protein